MILEKRILGAMLLDAEAKERNLDQSGTNSFDIDRRIHEGSKEISKRLKSLREEGYVELVSNPNGKWRYLEYRLTATGRTAAKDAVEELKIENIIENMVKHEGKVTWKNKVLNHLYTQVRFGNMEVMPYATNQDGIMEAIGLVGERGHVCILLKRMESEGLIECQKRHTINDKGAVSVLRKCYSLTPLGVTVVQRMKGVA